MTDARLAALIARPPGAGSFTCGDSRALCDRRLALVTQGRNPPPAASSPRSPMAPEMDPGCERFHMVEDLAR